MAICKPLTRLTIIVQSIVEAGQRIAQLVDTRGQLGIVLTSVQGDRRPAGQ
jgi:hypothetical protein